MTAAVTEQAAAPVRIAQRHGTCGAPGCLRPIEGGMRITKPRGRAWQHLDCANPYAGRGRERVLR